MSQCCEFKSHRKQLYFLPTAYVDRVRFDTCLSIHPSICLSTPGGVPWPGPGGGVTPARSSWGDLDRGWVPQWGVPHFGYPSPSDLAGGYPIRPGWGGRYPDWRVLHFRNSPAPCRTWLRGGGSSTLTGGTPPGVVLDSPQSVCLLRSRGRTFLFAETL